MARRQQKYPDKPWIIPPERRRRWEELIDKGRGLVKRPSPDPEPKGGWQLWDWNTLKDVPQA
jgi:hypothetical protein